MSWLNLWDGLKTKTCRYLLQRYLGQFFENNLNLEQLKVDLYNGKAVVENISLKVKALNDLFEEQGWAFEVVSGHVGCLTAMVPWNALMTNDSSLNISNLTITLRPVTRCQSETTMLESMWSSVSSSMQMAEECMNQIDDDVPFLNHNNTLIGLEKFAETIDNVLNRIHANLINTTINIEYMLPLSAKRLIISVKADRVEYKNQTGYGKYEFLNEESGSNNDITDQSTNLKSLPMIAKHILVTNDLKIYTSEIIDVECKIPELLSIGHLCKIVEFRGCQNFKISVKQSENIVGPKINLEVLIDDIYLMVTPRQIHLLMRIFKGFDRVRPKEKMLNNYPNFTVKTENSFCHSKNNGVGLRDDINVSSLSLAESCISSTSANSIASSCYKDRINNGFVDKSGEILKFKVQIFKIVGVVLHNDILFENSSNKIGQNNSIFTYESFLNYFKIANHFFPSTKVKEMYTPIPDKNYLLFMVSALIINGNQQRLFNELTLKSTLSATMFDLTENIDNIENNLILFDRKKNCPEGYHTRPEIILSHISSYLFKQSSNTSSTKIECTIADCTADFDISIYDRLNKLFGDSPFMEKNKSDDITIERSNPMDLQVKCNTFKLSLRFPIIDIGSSQKIPAIKKNIRKDYLLFSFRNLLIQWKSYIYMIVDEIDGYYCDEASKSDIRIMHCLYQNNSGCLTDNEKICLKIYKLNEFLGDDVKLDCKTNATQKSKSPFSSKCSYGYSSHIDGFYDIQDKSDVFLPGDTDEINEFCESCQKSSNIKIVASVPNAKIVLESKKLYETLYNRLNGDLFMWEPKSSTVNEAHSICSFDLYVTNGILTVYSDVNEMKTNNEQCELGKIQFNLRGFRSFSVTSLNNDKNLGYFCIQLNEINVYHSGNILEDLKTVWDDEIDKNLICIICNIPKDKRIVNNRNEMLSIVAELRKQPDKHIKRIKLAFGINGAKYWHKPVLASCNWINQLMDFLNIADYPIEAYEPYALVSEIQGHIWNMAIEYRPKYLSYRALLDIGYCSLSSNIIYPMNGCTLRLMSEDCILSIRPIAHFHNDVEESIANINQFGFVQILNVGLLQFSIHINDQNKTYSNINLRSSIHDVHLKTCYDSADALAQLIAYIAYDKDLNSNDTEFTDIKKSNDASENHSNGTNDVALKYINNLIADAVKDVNTTTASNVLNTSKTIENNKIQNNKNTLYECSHEPDICHISDFESNIRRKTNSNDETTKNCLPQVKAELGVILSTHAKEVEEKDFHVIHDKEIYFMDKFGINQIYVSDGPLEIVDNHFCIPSQKVDILRPPVNFPLPDQSYTLCEMTFTWHLFGGKDFPDDTFYRKSTYNASPTLRTEMSEAYMEGVSNASNKCKTKLKKKKIHESNGSRNSDVLVEIQFTKIRFSHDAYPSHSSYSSRQMLVISDLEIRDRLHSSDINKLLYQSNKSNIQQNRTDENMISVKALNVRSSDAENRAEECSLKVSILPIRLNIDQDTLLFLEEFFSELVKKPTNAETSSNNNCNSTVTNQDLPKMTVKGLQSFQWNEEQDIDLENLSKTFDPKAVELTSFGHELRPIYFKEFIFSPALPICFDYHGRRVELSHGPITGLVMGLAQLQGSGICLREVINRRGILGWNKLFEYVSKEWLKDIKRNQLPNILSGIGPTNAVLQLFQGFFDLFRLPLQQYNKDGRIIRGFQLGAQSFSARTAIAALEITSRIIHLLQLTAETTFDMLSTGPSLSRRNKSKHDKRRQCRPKDLREGVSNAYAIVKEGINESANTLLEAAIVEHDQKGYSGAVGAVVRQLPQLVVCPAVLATQATTNILGGAKSSLVPEAKREATDKWKHSKN